MGAWVIGYESSLSDSPEELGSFADWADAVDGLTVQMRYFADWDDEVNRVYESPKMLAQVESVLRVDPPSVADQRWSCIVKDNDGSPMTFFLEWDEGRRPGQ